MSPLVLTGAGVSIEDVAAAARNSTKVEVTPLVIEKLGKARKVLDEAAAAGQQIYGLNTGLGANLGTAVEGDAGAFQRQLLDGRGAAVGEALPMQTVRAVMFARIAMLSAGGSGLSPHVFTALVEALNAGVHPVMPSLGSIGAGDLVLMTAIAHTLIGEGDADYQSRRMPSAKALMMARLAPVSLAPKDGLSLINASAVSAGTGALALVDALSAMEQQQQAAALTMEALGANRTILDQRQHVARPAACQLLAAKTLRELLARDQEPAPTTIQDPLSIRCMPSIHGALIQAIDHARLAVEIELNAAADNPLVLAEDALVLSTGNFHTASLALAFETLGIAIAQCAAACAARFIQLTGSSRHGLPKYLSPIGGASAGFVPLQKTVSAILGGIRQKANPVMLDFLPVSEGVEDHATQTPLAIAKCAEMITLWRRLVALELMAAAQAVDLREGLVLAPATGVIHAAVRTHVATLKEDRPLGTSANALYAALTDGTWQA
ncbi:histidine ammonia-lyase [Mesorhizobium sp. M2D.F.Ca.ET.185.01.1.1]|uniref:HAL/PAL/TAL family ammonia-lyase n=1 Tax=unclassified Mesorhizobium TaxID=325217 RepID=UPI000FCC4F9C|nr:MULTISPECIES: histidine ammonia-lyase [unclassified Mesorhizobium]TGP80525.1 histidine ammonia-lyase [bacterium M00.F.Ca.ET.227.01.1.1]TGQ00506.1 histidine ammonia-lyase [bacterium M00.F.Ca.ET.221.01.1.1]TGQ02970.1 histidine ammonia-lyase [bacterium M00.F.Ca.ET.222.01.1.1]TGT74349.1 histidine ammonia-lyase [bacterium M00.F.Ca.ET.159.01.1.1]TGT86599.1 histidine ammonia-lyase [bacterium M00.F.Ca.ET.157.01.1.1]TGU09363.1 histidine ammonia-lyase [bacterium M00.F.Ca.ET.163.01.1.1]TGU32600.1 hi